MAPDSLAATEGLIELHGRGYGVFRRFDPPLLPHLFRIVFRSALY